MAISEKSRNVCDFEIILFTVRQPSSVYRSSYFLEFTNFECFLPPLLELKLNHELISKLLTVEVVHARVAHFFNCNRDTRELPGESCIGLAT